ncbi:MAG: alanine--tRNA ligase, partial [Proteobacteria bacterium]|nr:alanine--tRNA ligase [Pseudomonadota bacterium]
MMRTNDIRHAFLSYFKNHDHAIVDSGPLVPHNDSTLLFTNSGMVQFKNIFTGQETTSIPRATTAQKCVRAGGKHNDLENVGHTARHHTFFEMLGNFSFGDYFKERAIDLAWNLITKEFGLDKNRLLVTIYHDDEDAAKFWRKVAGLDDKRIIRIATSDNFWSMGETGPCGPCSEIFYDHGEAIAGGPPGSKDADGDRFIEIWNLVFMQYEQRDAKTRVDLPRPSIDTGMGLERIAAILQGKHDNYDIDLMQHLIEAVADASATKAGGDHRIAQRVIADHLRSACFLLADGVLPSNEGRGYVLRRIMRRAMRHAHQMGCKQPLLYQLVPTLITQMGGHYTELKRGEALMREVLKLEEERFKETLGRGLAILNETMQQGSKSGDTKSKTKQTLDGSIAFKLYDTYGFPLDLTEDVLRQHGWQVDVAGFETAMAQQKQAARKAWAGSGDKDLTQEMQFLHNLAGNFAATEFLGYETLEASGQILTLVKNGGEVKTLTAAKGEKAEKKTQAYLIANQTPFYAESGGQEGDHGVLTDEAGKLLARITNTFKISGVFFHVIEMEAGAEIKIGDSVRFVVDSQRRQLLRCNHSATHLLHAALRQHLGTHVTQKGSLVAEGRLRFDFSHPKAVTSDQLAAIEETVNKRLRLNSQVTTRIMTEKAAVAEGALALFGEKYGDEVRVVAMGGN